MRISDWSSDVCSSDLADPDEVSRRGAAARVQIYPKSPSQPLTALPRTAGLIGSQPGPPQSVPIGTGGVGMVDRQFILGTSVSVLALLAGRPAGSRTNAVDGKSMATSRETSAQRTMRKKNKQNIRTP